MRYYLAAYPGNAKWDYGASQSTTDPTVLATFAARHLHVFLIQANFSPSPETLCEMNTVQAFMDSHYQLLGQFSTSHMDYQFKGTDLVTSEIVRMYATGARAPEVLKHSPSQTAPITIGEAHLTFRRHATGAPPAL